MDSDNILSILAALGGEQAPIPQNIEPLTYSPLPMNNILQAARAIGEVPHTPPIVAAPRQPSTEQTPERPRKRLSVFDIIGRLADTVATVGGSQPMYQPTLDAIRERESQVDLDALRRRLTVAQVGEAEMEPQLAARKRLGTALGALANNPDAAALWPSIAEQAGITDPQQIAAIGAQLAQNPNSAGIFAKALGADIDNLGKNVYFGSGPDGKTVAYQVGPDGQPHILDFGRTGITPSDPLKVVNTGGANVVLDSRGQPRNVLANSAKPDTLVNADTSRGNNIRTNRTNLTIAGMPARSRTAAGAGGDTSVFAETAQGNLNELRAIYSDLYKMGAMVSEAQSKDKNVVARIRASGIGQLLEGAAGTQAQTQRDRIASIRPALMQSLSKATGMTGRQLDSNADVKLFMQTVTDPTRSYEANMKAIEGLERFLKTSIKKPAAPAAKPAANSGWKIVKVQ
jgi:hypothetical protein